MVRSNRQAPDKYEVQDAAHTLKRAHHIRKDKHMMRHVKKYVKKEAGDMAQLAQALGAMGGGQGGQGMPQPPQNMAAAFGP